MALLACSSRASSQSPEPVLSSWRTLNQSPSLILRLMARSLWRETHPLSTDPITNEQVATLKWTLNFRQTNEQALGPVVCVPAVHVQVHPLGLLEPAEVRRHLGLLHGLTLQVSQALDKLDALVVFAADEGLLGRLQVQLLQSRLRQQTPNREKPA